MTMTSLTRAAGAMASISLPLRDAYLARIGYSGPMNACTATLKGLHRAHMLTVPFENLDIYGGRRALVLDQAAFVRKVVEERRGGYCYELNGAFAALLTCLGFEVEFLSGRVLSNGVEGPEFDHLLLSVVADGQRFIADVGFGESSREPLRLAVDEEQPDGVGSYRLTRAGETWSHWGLGANGKWNELYRFSLTPHRLEEYREMFEYHQTSPKSPFTRNTVCSLATVRGRITLSGNRLTTVEDGERTIRRLGDPAEVPTVLREQFGVVLREPGDRA